MRRILSLAIIIVAIASMASCKKGSRGEKTMLPNVTGAAGEVVVVLPKEIWNDTIGRSYKAILKEEYPYIPQPEPYFDMILIPDEAFTNIFKTHRNIVLTTVSPEHKTPQFIIKRDVWAAPQTVVNLVGPDYPAVTDYLVRERDRFTQIIEQAERDRIIQNAVKYEEKPLRELLTEKFKISMNFPKGYKLNKNSDNFVWISHETPDISQGVFIYAYPYTDANTFTADYLINRRNEFVKQIPGPTQGSYMVTSMVFPPKFTPLMYRDRYFGQLRGFREVENHAMGGPFISLSTLDEKRNQIITIEGYVYAPRFKKRNYVRQVEALLLTFSVSD